MLAEDAIKAALADYKVKQGSKKEEPGKQWALEKPQLITAAASHHPCTKPEKLWETGTLHHLHCGYNAGKYTIDYA